MSLGLESKCIANHGAQPLKLDPKTERAAQNIVSDIKERFQGQEVVASAVIGSGKEMQVVTMLSDGKGRLTAVVNSGGKEKIYTDVSSSVDKCPGGATTYKFGNSSLKVEGSSAAASLDGKQGSQLRVKPDLREGATLGGAQTMRYPSDDAASAPELRFDESRSLQYPSDDAASAPALRFEGGQRRPEPAIREGATIGGAQSMRYPSDDAASAPELRFDESRSLQYPSDDAQLTPHIGQNLGTLKPPKLEEVFAQLKLRVK